MYDELEHPMLDDTGPDDQALDAQLKQLAVIMALACTGLAQMRAAAVQWLDANADAADWQALAAALHALLAGERDAAVLLDAERDLDATDQAIISLILELLDDPAALEAAIDELLPEEHPVAELIVPTVQALLGGTTERLALVNRLQTMPTDNPEINAFVGAAQQALFGAEPRALLDQLSGPSAQAWAQVVLFFETDALNPDMLEEAVLNTIAVHGSAAAQRDEWLAGLRDSWLPQLQGRPRATAFFNALIALIEADGDASGLAVDLSPAFTGLWQQALAGIAELRRTAVLETLAALVSPLALALHGDAAAQQAVSAQLSQVADDPQFQPFVAAAQRALAGEPVQAAGARLSGAAADAWAVLLTTLQAYRQSS